MALAIFLAYCFGYSFTLVPLLRGGMAVKAALGLAFVADTLSITVMEIVDNGSASSGRPTRASREPRLGWKRVPPPEGASVWRDHRDRERGCAALVASRRSIDLASSDLDPRHALALARHSRQGRDSCPLLVDSVGGRTVRCVLRSAPARAAYYELLACTGVGWSRYSRCIRSVDRGRSTTRPRPLSPKALLVGDLA